MPPVLYRSESYRRLATMTTSPLSPAAQAIRDAYKSGGLDAALIAAADQVVPEELWLVSMMGPVYVAEAK